MLRAAIPVPVLPQDLLDDVEVVSRFLSPHDLVATNSPVVDTESKSTDPVVNLLNLLGIDKDHPQFEQVHRLINRMPRDIFPGYDELCAIENIETRTETALFDDIQERVKKEGIALAEKIRMTEVAQVAVAREKMFFLFHLLHYFAAEKEMTLSTRFKVKRAITNAFCEGYTCWAWKGEAFFSPFLLLVWWCIL